jgi:lipid II isoglutaminyl synthase (glutamine-hydrolysing)
MTYALCIAHLYPEQMNIYGDRGNILALKQRCAWRGIAVELLPVGVGAEVDWERVDLAFFGGGQDSGQLLIAEDLLLRKGPALRAAIDAGLVLLAICGGYQLLGHYFLTHTGERLAGLGALDLHTVAGHTRLIGNIVVEADLTDQRPTTNDQPTNDQRPTTNEDKETRRRGDKETRESPISNLQSLDSFLTQHSTLNTQHSERRTKLVGFENHSGCTYLGSGVRPLGRVLAGHGNNGADGTEGAIYRNTLGCYMHGSLLPKNPQLADRLIGLALRRRYGPQAALVPLDDAQELRAQRTMIGRLLNG